MDRSVAYLLRLNNAPSRPGGPFAPCADDDELRADEEALRNRHLARLRSHEHRDMLQRLRSNVEQTKAGITPAPLRGGKGQKVFLAAA